MKFSSIINWKYHNHHSFLKVDHWRSLSIAGSTRALCRTVFNCIIAHHTVKNIILEILGGVIMKWNCNYSYVSTETNIHKMLCSVAFSVRVNIFNIIKQFIGWKRVCLHKIYGSHQWPKQKGSSFFYLVAIFFYAIQKLYSYNEYRLWLLGVY